MKALARKILLSRENFFSGDKLNSEGRKVFEELARMLVDEHPYLKQRVRAVRRRGDMESFLKIARLVLGDEEVERLLRAALEYPYYLRGLDA